MPFVLLAQYLNIGLNFECVTIENSRFVRQDLSFFVAELLLLGMW
jgi:hypothetical protein